MDLAVYAKSSSFSSSLVHWHRECAAICCSKARIDDTTSETSTSGLTSAFTGYLISGRSLTLPGRSSPTGSSASNQSMTSGGISISNTHSLSLPNLQQHCATADTSSFINDPVEWVSLMTSMNLGEVGDVDDTTESRLVFFGGIVVVLIIIGSVYFAVIIALPLQDF